MRAGYLACHERATKNRIAAVLPDSGYSFFLLFVMLLRHLRHSGSFKTPNAGGCRRLRFNESISISDCRYCRPAAGVPMSDVAHCPVLHCGALLLRGLGRSKGDDSYSIAAYRSAGRRCSAAALPAVPAAASDWCYRRPVRAPDDAVAVSVAGSRYHAA